METLGADLKLTRCELRVLQLISTGKSSKAVAAELYVSKRTIDSHLLYIYKKLEAGNRTEAIYRARLLGLLD